MSRRRKRSLARGNTIYLFGPPPKKRSPVRIDRSVPLDYETYLAEKHERERLAARDPLFATSLGSASAPRLYAAEVSNSHEVSEAESVDDDEVPDDSDRTADVGGAVSAKRRQRHHRRPGAPTVREHLWGNQTRATTDAPLSHPSHL